ncbi:hypothetical protein ELUMI_v1c08450 [Williamsoniiplasma luminosum]|uniref:HTH rpiR-type domain-containing protein n=1 Tax=Williamsoniiplasma luminosum TaxID=214888 RepID=A0A2K8NVJ3_9MOLU|nr:hypothetical protein [Williamsoniiplasma luminosum]ATZ17566.1 hypothetical protein ELUMI_v1c08450 [Williamsoniiplasma luminosum]
MGSIKEVLDIIARDSIDKTTQHIAQEIIKEYYNGNFMSQQELSKKAYTSMSTITKFAQKIGFTGYRELLFSLKYENEQYAGQIIGYKDSDEDLETHILNQTKFYRNILLQNAPFIDAFAKHLAKTKKLVIFSSYQTHRNADLLVQLLSPLDIEIRYSNIRANDVLIGKKDFENWTILTLISGQDNAFMVEILKLGIPNAIKKNNLFLVSSKSQMEKVPLFKEYMITPSTKMTGTYYSRSILLDMIATLILREYKALSK